MAISPKAIVIGAGINGLCIVKRLLSKGWQVELFDRGAIPNEKSASHGRHRLIHPWQKTSSNDVRSAAQALSSWKTLLNDLRFDGFIQTGVVVANTTQADSDYSRARDENSTRISRAEAESLMPQLSQGKFFDITLYPEFGCLLADQILYHLVRDVVASGAVIYPNHEIIDVKTDEASILCRDGQSFAGDIVVATGSYGARPLMRAAGVPAFAQPMRCYVLYVVHDGTDGSRSGKFCWASLGSDIDLWGMPPLKGIPGKLGCGDLTACMDPESPSDLAAVKEKLLSKYRHRFPLFLTDARETALHYNHWTLFDREEIVTTHDKMILVTACSGGGFKFAPETANLAMTRIAEIGR